MSFKPKKAALKRAHQGLDHLVMPLPEEIRSSSLQLVLCTLNVEEDKHSMTEDLYKILITCFDVTKSLRPCSMLEA